MDELARTRERRIVDRHAGELHREVRLDRRAQVPRTAVVERPAPVGALHRLHAPDQAVLRFLAPPPHEAVEDDVLRVHPDVGLERRVPVAVAVLEAEEPRLCARDRLVETLREVVGRPARDGKRRDRRHAQLLARARSARPRACSAM